MKRRIFFTLLAILALASTVSAQQVLTGNERVHWDKSLDDGAIGWGTLIYTIYVDGNPTPVGPCANPTQYGQCSAPLPAALLVPGPHTLDVGVSDQLYTNVVIHSTSLPLLGVGSTPTGTIPSPPKNLRIIGISGP